MNQRHISKEMFKLFCSTRWFLSLLSLVALSLPSAVIAKETNPSAVISIIIDDIGYRLKEGQEMINLPGNLTYAVLPNAPEAKKLANLAHQRGKEVMLHMPMQSTLGAGEEQGVLNVDMDEASVVLALRAAFEKVPYATGMNNHQGSLLTRHPGHMEWIMKEMAKQRKFFVDSRTSKQSVAVLIAKEQNVPVVGRDVFLDHDIDEASIRFQFNRLVQIAQKKGHAVGIGHPHPETLAVLRDMLPSLEALNIKVVPISRQLDEKELLASNFKTIELTHQHDDLFDKKH